MTTWVQPIHHPWFDHSPLKRKLSNADDERCSSSYQRSSPSPTSRAKRRRFNTLEHGFAHLSLASAPVHSSSAGGLLITPIAHPTVSSSEYSVFPPASVVLPSSVEEPPHELEASMPEVSMEYENERQCKLSSLQVSSSSFEAHTQTSPTRWLPTLTCSRLMQTPTRSASTHTTRLLALKGSQYRHLSFSAYGNTRPLHSPSFPSPPLVRLAVLWCCIGHYAHLLPLGKSMNTRSL